MRYEHNDTLNHKLSCREKECLKWIAAGKKAEEIAIILNLKLFTVRYYLRSIRYKLNCQTMAQAVCKALTYQLIDTL